MAEKRTRRSKEETLNYKISQINMEIEKHNKKVEELTESKQTYQKQLEELHDEKLKAEREQKMGELIKLIDKKGYTFEEIEKLLTQNSTDTKINAE